MLKFLCHEGECSDLRASVECSDFGVMTVSAETVVIAVSVQIVSGDV